MVVQKAAGLKKKMINSVKSWGVLGAMFLSHSLLTMSILQPIIIICILMWQTTHVALVRSMLRPIMITCILMWQTMNEGVILQEHKKGSLKIGKSLI